MRTTDEMKMKQIVGNAVKQSQMQKTGIIMNEKFAESKTNLSDCNMSLCDALRELSYCANMDETENNGAYKNRLIKALETLRRGEAYLQNAHMLAVK